MTLWNFQMLDVISLETPQGKWASSRLESRTSWIFSSCGRCYRLAMGTSGTRSCGLRKDQYPCELLGVLSGFLSRRCRGLKPQSFRKEQVSKSEGDAFPPSQAAAVPAFATRGRDRQGLAVLLGTFRPLRSYLRGSLPASPFRQRRRPQIPAPRAKAATATATAPVTSGAK